MCPSWISPSSIFTKDYCLFAHIVVTNISTNFSFISNLAFPVTLKYLLFLLRREKFCISEDHTSILEPWVNFWFSFTFKISCFLKWLGFFFHLSFSTFFILSNMLLKAKNFSIFKQTTVRLKYGDTHSDQEFSECELDSLTLWALR